MFGLGIRAGVLVIVGLFSCWFYGKWRHFWRTLFENSPAVRGVFVIGTILFLPIFIGAWSDVADFSQLADGHITWVQTSLLSLIAFTATLYFYFHGCWFDWEELLNSRTLKADAEAKELECQRNFLLRFLEYLQRPVRGCAKRFYTFLNEVDCDPSNLLQTIHHEDDISRICEAVRQAYKLIHTVPGEATVTAALFKEENHYLEPVIVFDGAAWRADYPEFAQYREHFDLTRPDCSVAVAATLNGVPWIVPDTAEAHGNSHHPFKFFANETKQRQEVKSMVAIPATDPLTKARFVFCVVCDHANVFLEDHSWKAEQSSRYLAEALSLVYRCNDLLHAVQIRFDQLAGERANQLQPDSQQVVEDKLVD